MQGPPDLLLVLMPGRAHESRLTAPGHRAVTADEIRRVQAEVRSWCANRRCNAHGVSALAAGGLSDLAGSTGSRGWPSAGG